MIISKIFSSAIKIGSPKTSVKILSLLLRRKLSLLIVLRRLIVLLRLVVLQLRLRVLLRLVVLLLRLRVSLLRGVRLGVGLLSGLLIHLQLCLL